MIENELTNLQNTNQMKRFNLKHKSKMPNGLQEELDYFDLLSSQHGIDSLVDSSPYKNINQPTYVKKERPKTGVP